MQKNSAKSAESAKKKSRNLWLGSFLKTQKLARVESQGGQVLAILKSISENSLEKQSASRVVNLPGFLRESRTGIFLLIANDEK